MEMNELRGDELLDLLKRRRSIRKFKPDPVPDEYIGKILEAGRWAMSGANGQPWQFIVIKDPETKKKIAETHAPESERTGVIESMRVLEYRMPRYRTYTTPKIFWEDAPVIIAVLGDPRTIMASVLSGRYNFRHVYEQNMANVTQTICLAAAAFGLGTQWVSINVHAAEPLKPILGVPPIIDIFTLVPVGYPAHKPAGHRRELSELVSYEKYDMSKYRSEDEILKFLKNLRGQHKVGDGYPEADVKA